MVSRRVHQILHDLGRAVDSIPAEEIERFCKNSAFVKALRYRSLASEYGADVKCATINSELGDPESSMFWYVMLRAVDGFFTAHKRYPGESCRWFVPNRS